MSAERARAVSAASLVLLLGGVLLSVLAAPGVRILGHRGATRLSEGFKPGRWDARFLVARAPAALVFPETSIQATLLLSGPAQLSIRTGDLLKLAVLGPEPMPVATRLVRGGRVELTADATIRLHELRVTRLEPPPWPRLLALLAATLLAAAVAFVRPVPVSVLGSLLAMLLAAAAALRGPFPSLVALALWDRAWPLIVLAGVALTFLLPRLVRPTGTTWRRPVARELWLPAACGVLLFASCLLQVGRYEQPLLIGDPAAYHEIGGRFRDALGAVRSFDDLADALHELRPYGGLALTGLVYGALRGLHDQLATIYFTHALALAGCAFLLVWVAGRLSGTRLAVITTALVLSYSTFPVLVGLVQPEPFILLLWTAAFATLVSALARGDERGVALAGLLFALGLALHPQGLWFLLLALALVLLPFLGRLLAHAARRLLRAFVIGLLPVAIAMAAGEAFARPVGPVLDERHGFWAYTADYPLGFWLFLDTDGWQGPLRIDDTRYARALRAAEQSGRPSSTSSRLLFTADFVRENAAASLRTVLTNLHRLFHVPDNPARRDYLLPYSAQVVWHRAIVALFLLGAALAWPGPAAFAYLPFAILSLSYPLYHVFNKYSVPATPFLLLGAALALGRIVEERRPALLAALLASGLGAWLEPASLAFLGVPPLAARAIVLLLHLGGLAMAFWLACQSWARDGTGRLLTSVAALLLIVPTIVVEWSDPGWRAFSVTLERPAEHEILLRPEEAAGLTAAHEAYLVLDLEIPSGDPSPLSLRFEGGLRLPGSELQPTMPAFGLATTRFQRDPRSFRQWWRLPWQKQMASDGRVRLTLLGNREARLYGALADGQQAVDRGLSLGEWPYSSVYRLMHDGEYRLAREQALGGLKRTSRSSGRVLPGSLGVRLLQLSDGMSLARVATAPVPAAAQAWVTAVWARTSSLGAVDLELPRETLAFRFQDRGVLARSGSGQQAAEVRFAPTGDAEGYFLIRAPTLGATALTLTFRPRQEMASPPRFVAPELRGPAPIPLDWTGYPYAPVVKVLESRVQPWRPEAVY